MSRRSRTRRELLAIGENASRGTVETGPELTVQEGQARATGPRRPVQPGHRRRLFITAGTVQYSLHEVFAKLAISSRSQLDRVQPDDTTATEPG